MTRGRAAYFFDAMMLHPQGAEPRTFLCTVVTASVVQLFCPLGKQAVSDFAGLVLFVCSDRPLGILPRHRRLMARKIVTLSCPRGGACERKMPYFTGYSIRK